MLLPCQFKLLNGDTNAADVDGMDFNGNRPTTISGTASYNPTNIITTDIATTNVTDGTGNGGIDTLGADPMGQGRASYPGIANVDSLMVLAKVSPAAATNITYGWARGYLSQAVTIAYTSTNTWYVKGIPGYTTNDPNDIDQGLPVYHTLIPSTNNNVLSCYDNPGIALSAYASGAPHTNDYGYMKCDFTYALTNFIGSTNAVATQHVGQIIAMKRIATTGTDALNWTNVINIASTTNIPNGTSFTTNEIRAIVAPSTNAIIFDSSVPVSP